MFRSTIFFITLFFGYSPGYNQESRAIQEEIAEMKKKRQEYVMLIRAYDDSVKMISALIVDLEKDRAKAELNELKEELSLEARKRVYAELKHGTYLRSEPNQLSASLLRLNPKSKIVLIDRIKDTPYYKVEYKKTVGYVRYDHLNLTGTLMYLEKELHRYIGDPATTTQGYDRYTPVPTTRNESESRDIHIHSSNCESVQCSGVTKKGHRCKNITTNCNGRCHHH
jgi:hypothetical protein